MKTPLNSTTLHTQRLRLEPFDERHLDGLHAMNSLPEVMRYVGGQTETREQTASVIKRVKRCWAAWGTSWWAIIETKSERVAGAGCIQYLLRDASPPEDLESLKRNPMEIGWRLHPEFWRQGLASEAARCMAAFAFDRFPIEELLAVRHPENAESVRVMERLGMRQRGLEPWYGTTVATHVILRSEWQRTKSAAGEAQPLAQADPLRQLRSNIRPHMPGFTSRPASAEDLDLTYRITRDAMRPYVEATWGAWNEDEQLAKHALNYQPQTHRIIIVDAEEVGLLAVEVHDDHLWLVKVYLFEAWRNQGIGRSLICQVLDQGRQLGKPVRLRVLRVNDRARKLYESLGFRVVSEMPERFVMEAFTRAV